MCVSMVYCTLNNNTFKLFFNREHVREVNLTISFVSHFNKDLHEDSMNHETYKGLVQLPRQEITYM